MNNYAMDKIRNICVLAHGGAGKTSLVEAMLHCAGASDRFGKVADGTTVTDYDPEEIKRKISINTAVAPFEWKGIKLNVLDTPGYFDFVGEVMQGIRVADAALIVVNAKSGVAVGTENSWEYAKERNIPIAFFVNQLDDENADYIKVVGELTNTFGKSVAPFQIPIKENAKLTGFVDIIDLKAYKFDGAKTTETPIPDNLKSEVDSARQNLTELVAETSEELMDKFFSGEDFTRDEMVDGLRSGVRSGDVVPVFCGSAINNLGVAVLLDALCEYFPSPAENKTISAKDSKTGEKISIEASAQAPLAALVFKTIADPYVGKLSIFRVYSGEIKSDSTVYNANTQTQEKIGHLYVLRGKKQIEVDTISTGDIGAVTKLASTFTGDTLCTQAKSVLLEGIDFPKPNLSLAIVPKAKGDEEKISNGLHKLMEEDQTFKVENNLETRQLLISGMGESHLDVIVSKLKSKFGVSVDLKEPEVPYRETIRKKVKVEGKHKKQTGGHGQYGHVWIEFEPSGSDDFVFEEKIFGGAVPKNYFPAVEKGLRECLSKGVLAGYPVVGLKATLVDGSYHPVDSSEMAFKIAASIAYKEGLKQASPVLLEPIGYLKVVVPESLMGDIIGDINKRRGRVLGMNPIGKGLGEVEAEVPMAEMFKYATDLRSMTSARGKFTFEFVRYEEAPPNVTQKVIEQRKKAEQEEQ